MAPSHPSAIDRSRPLPSAADLRHWETPYADALERHAARGPLALMVPGHGGDELGLSARLADFLGSRPLELDVPMLIDDIDLGEDSPLRRSLDLAADAWGARRTWFLTGGASQANRVAALAVRGLGENILSQRSAHSSFSDGVLSAGLVPSFVLPSIDTDHGVAHGVSPAALDDALTAAASSGRPADAVYIVSPSYFGAVADVAALAQVAHAQGAPLIVDGAWGPHFGFHPGLPESPARLGADLVVSSTHKLGGSLTQSAMLHLGHGPFAAALEPLVERAVSITASTSTSALLLASLDIARHSLATGAELIGRSIAVADAFREALRSDPRFGVLSDGFGAFGDIVAVDPLRVAIDVSGTGVSGHWLRQRLIDADRIFFEMSTATSLVALIGAGKTPDLGRAHRALAAAVDSEEAHAERAETAAHEFPALPESGALRMLPRDAFFADTELVPAAEAVGRISADTLAAYPPGIPNLIPGEEITAPTVAFLQAVAASPSGFVRGAVDHRVERFRVTRPD
ncbi:aminotransferase class I/II-fold pyridoxal phosphate-dependent enzyme [Leifsonia sp. AG29]|uniref:aminotransferase class I/II-fold pyridoxal phosphate-dependent enzyme n=1 Tax=Leifsonia sp. AG29 TaxID=2598860 RepID=UPI00131E9EAB|nr:PLP-dependent transferase [Leifsonia sp. AG29]